ncbi:MAG: 30S ribosomal protein S16 [Hymenobacteraceae bacterium]|nr:30S ribosomal protein S16 [Hymenobacteraceae bacterium]MDX5395922.1 30S ribosomal protein S16 [Hymenobacteraceae bacterium]MDX5443873.1 30S ribosomal protein S16 [Hymenobacteraceae bacterium]MDX5511980.1 30S ribosomal protein S16 [Hymenobacteraceae bacterium]
MPVKIRLARRGRKKAAIYDIVVADSKSPRDGRFIEKIGTYNPNTNPAFINYDEEKAFQWVMKGAQPTDTVKAMLSYRGILLRKHLQIGVVKGAITQDQADTRFQEWKSAKDAKIEGKVARLGSEKEAKRRAALEAEAKVSAARAEAIAKRKAEAEAANQPAAETTEGEAAAENTSEEQA